MAKKRIDEEIKRALDAESEAAHDDGAKNDMLHEDDLFNAPMSLEHLRKYSEEFEKILKDSEDELEETGYNDLTDAQRHRLLGSGVRRLGFIIKTFEIATENPLFIPGFLDMQRYADLLTEITESRNIVISLEQLVRIYNDVLLIAGNDAFRLALMYYNAVKDGSRRGVPGAQAIFRRLEAFFRRGRTSDVEEMPDTNKETVSKVKKLLEGKADGSMFIEGHSKHTTASEHSVVDNTYKPHGAFRETIEGTLCGGCNTQNVAHAKFCINCGKALKS